MKILWLCLHDTYSKRKSNPPLFNGERIEFVSGAEKFEANDDIVIIEGRDLNIDIIKLVTSKDFNKNSAVFIENFSIDIINLQVISIIASYGIPFFWNVDDLIFYIHLSGRLKNNPGDKLHTLLAEELMAVESSFHSENVSSLSFLIAERLSCPLDTAFLIRSASMLHDMGKLLMPRSFINAPRWYTMPEKEYIKFHTLYGLSLLDRIFSTDSIFYHIAKDIVLYHHERMDGSGYPYGRRGDEIPLSARIVAVADVYDALRSNRPYRTACDHDLAITYLKGKNGIFDGKIIKILEEIVIENSDIWDKNTRYCLPENKNAILKLI